MGTSFHQQVIAYNILLALCWISTSGRIYVRKFVVRKMGIDDWLLIFVLIAFTVSIWLSTWMAKLGLGRKDSQIPPENIPKFIKLFYISGLIYFVQAIVLKLSITFLLLRFAQNRTCRLTIICTSIFSTLYGIATLLIGIFECVPAKALWDFSVHGKCISTSTITAVSYCNTIIGTITDATFAIVPIFLVWNLPMDKKSKISTAFVLSLGLSTSGINLARVAFLNAFESRRNIPYKVYPICLTATLEIGFGIIATSLVTIRPLLRQLMGRNPITKNTNLKSRPTFNRSDLDTDIETYNTHSSQNMDEFALTSTNGNDKGADISLTGGVVLEPGNG